MFKNLPTPGYQYIVKRGDDLSTIEVQAYGYETGTLDDIHPFLQGRNRNPESGRLFVYTGDTLTIPEIAKTKSEQQTKKITNKRKDQITIVLGDREIPFSTCRILRTMDTAADAWTCSLAWVPGKDPEFDNLISPFQYTPAQVYIGNELIINGSLYGVQPQSTETGLTIVLTGYSFAADVIDSTMPEPYEEENITGEERVNSTIKGMGIKAVFERIDSDPQFDRVVGEITDTIFGHLSELAFQRGILISSTPNGDLLFTRANVNGKSVGTLRSGSPLPLGWGANFDGRKLFNSIRAIGESPGDAVKQAVSVDSNIPKSRFMTFKADNTTTGNIQDAANWKRSKQYAEALTIPFPVTGFYAPDGTLYRENKIVTVISAEIFVPNGFDFLIKQVEYQQTADGNVTTLGLVPPAVYSGEKIDLNWETVK